MPVAASTRRESVSTAITWVLSLFHGQYFNQFPVDTSFQEYSKSCEQENTFIAAPDAAKTDKADMKSDGTRRVASCRFRGMRQLSCYEDTSSESSLL